MPKLWRWSGPLDDQPAKTDQAIDLTKDVLVHRARVTLTENTEKWYTRIYVFRTKDGERLAAGTVHGNWQYRRICNLEGSFILPKDNPFFAINEYPDASVDVLIEMEYDYIE